MLELTTTQRYYDGKEKDEVLRGKGRMIFANHDFFEGNVATGSNRVCTISNTPRWLGGLTCSRSFRANREAKSFSPPPRRAASVAVRPARLP